MSNEVWILIGQLYAWMMAAGLAGAAIGFAIARHLDDLGDDE